MAQKAPKIFRREYSQEQFQKKILKKIYLHEYKDFLQKATQKTPSGTIALRPDLDKKELVQLKKIAKTIKKNTGIVLKGRLTLLLLIFGGVILFNVVFKDMLVEMAAEAGLEAVFNAKADIQGLHFQVLAGRLSFRRLEVADSEKPMHNLFELGETVLDVDLFELLKGKVILDNIVCRDIKWDTERKTSGALHPAGPEQAKQAEKKPEEKKADEGMVPGLNITQADIDKLIEEQKQNLGSLKLLAGYGESYAKLTASWQDAQKENGKKMETLSRTMAKVNEIKFDNIKNLADAESAYTTIKATIAETDTVKKEIEQSSKAFSGDLSRMKKDQKTLSAAMEADYKNIAAKISLPAQGQGGVVSAIAQGFLARYLGGLNAYVTRAGSYLAMLKPASAQEVKEKKPGRFKGMDIQFPSFVKPKFWLKNMSFSVVNDASFGTISGDLRDLAGEPDLINKPVTFALTQALKEEAVSLKGSIDLRKNQAQVVVLQLALKNFPFRMNSGLYYLSIADFKCKYAMDVDFVLDNRNHSSGRLKLTLSDLAISYSQDDLVSKGLQKAIATLPYITMGAGYSIDRDGKPVLQMTENNIDEVIRAILGSLMEELATGAMNMVKQEMDKLLEKDLKQYQENFQEMTLLARDFEQKRLDLGNYKKILDAKKKEAEKKLRQYKKVLIQDIDKIL